MTYSLQFSLLALVTFYVSIILFSNNELHSIFLTTADHLKIAPEIEFRVIGGGWDVELRIGGRRRGSCKGQNGGQQNHEEYISSTEAPSSPFQRMICQRFEKGVYGSPKPITLPVYTLSHLNGAFPSRPHGLLPSGFQSPHERPRHFTIGHHRSNILSSPDEPSTERARCGSERTLPCYERYSDPKLSPSDLENEAEKSDRKLDVITEIGERDQPIFQYKQFLVQEIEPDWTTSDMVLTDLLPRFPKKDIKIFSNRLIYDSHKQPQRSRIRLSLKRFSDSYTKEKFIKRLKTEASR
ncbi:hypothetical protein CROQUDRAFT_712484 [Cronartium quercuum f. sp. fusiforme G11]|uniref:Uncharacterized protein n=1 Tax=Cronartium quercuum f. sp. fusiforme G11 TaxID=708437 RepID=A0A9P6TIX0_9BASI|nr:hypothetical protein CROQUDRAFT_712484 [Cronartium quercuum f. sp. fusiforme G11]